MLPEIALRLYVIPVAFWTYTVVAIVQRDHLFTQVGGWPRLDLDVRELMVVKTEVLFDENGVFGEFFKMVEHEVGVEDEETLFVPCSQIIIIVLHKWLVVVIDL